MAGRGAAGKSGDGAACQSRQLAVMTSAMAVSDAIFRADSVVRMARII